jgi:tRNA nucleotidyltransferase (CCA-adding enzyme)
VIIAVAMFAIVGYLIFHGLHQAIKNPTPPVILKTSSSKGTHIYCVDCGKNEAGNDNLCPQCRHIRQKLSEEHPYHLM